MRDFDDDIDALLAYLAANPVVNAKAIGAAGFCLGGHVAFRAALSPHVHATTCFYPTGLHDDELAGDGPAALTLAHVLGHAEVAHPFATELSASWMTHHPRHSQDPRRFTKGARLLAALHERDELPAASVGGKA